MSRGRGHTKESAEPQNSKRTKISVEHGQPIIRLSRAFINLGVKLDQDVVVFLERVDGNPLNWEIKVKPVRQYS